MKITTHKINWKAKDNRTKTDLSFEVTENNCYVIRVSHPIANWMIGEPWVRCYGWLRRKYAEITSIEVPENPLPSKNEDLYNFISKNPRRISDGEWLDRQR